MVFMMGVTHITKRMMMILMLVHIMKMLMMTKRMLKVMMMMFLHLELTSSSPSLVQITSGRGFPMK